MDLLDSNHCNAMLYCIIHDHKDDTLLLCLLINRYGNVKSIANFVLGNNIIKIHSLLALACKKGMINIASTLIKTGANINYKSYPSGYTDLYYTIFNNNVKLIQCIY